MIWTLPIVQLKSETHDQDAYIIHHYYDHTSRQQRLLTLTAILSYCSLYYQQKTANMEDVEMFKSLNLSQPKVPCFVTPAQGGETFMLGNLKFRIMEDGSHTDNRIGTAEITLPPKTKGPPAHW